MAYNSIMHATLHCEVVSERKFASQAMIEPMLIMFYSVMKEDRIASAARRQVCNVRASKMPSRR